jgi:NAD-dependent SIR2 family protein deacetylase
MRQQDGDTSVAAVGPNERILRGEVDEAHCAECGAPTGIHPRWWYDGDDELVPYCEECSPYVGSDRPS